MSYVKIFLIASVIFFAFSQKLFANSTNTFNQLVLAKSSLESSFDVRSVECFPFKDNVGFTEDQIPLIKNCLTGARLLLEALKKNNDYKINKVGISSRFLSTGGFNNYLIPWNASLQEVITFLENKISKEAQDKFLSQILRLKRKINRNFKIPSLYCSQRISNDQCMSGYKRLSLIKRSTTEKLSQWEEIILDDRQGLGKNSHSYRIKYDSPSSQMLEILQKDPQMEWLPRKKMYDNIKLKYQKAFERQLQIATYFCSTELTEKNCMAGMKSLRKLSQTQNMRMKAWGEVIIDKYNTFIKNDFDVSIRFDLSANKMVDYFSSKLNRVEATENYVLAEKLEKRTLNNSSGLRAVCDLEGMRSNLCSKAFKDFIKFLSNDRDYRVKAPWTNIMFIDGDQLSRVNFALNSSARHSYIYIDAGSGPKELKHYLEIFKR